MTKPTSFAVNGIRFSIAEAVETIFQSRTSGALGSYEAGVSASFCSIECAGFRFWIERARIGFIARIMRDGRVAATGIAGGVETAVRYALEAA